MPSKIVNTLIQNDRKFSVNFKLEKYDSYLNNLPILGIWTDLVVNLKQEEKYNSFLYLYHEIKRTDSLESISQIYYQTESYWWLILLANECEDPFDFLEDKLQDGVSIKIIKANYLSKVLNVNKSLDIFDYLKGTNGGR